MVSMVILGKRPAEIFLQQYDSKNLIFCAPTNQGLEKYQGKGIELRTADFNDESTLAKSFDGADVVILISMPFVGPRRRDAHKRAIDACVKAGVNKIVYTSIVGAGDKNINTYEVNDHVWTEAYIKSQHSLMILKNW